MNHSPKPIAVVTGAASGIGHAFVERFTREGQRCVALDVDLKGVEGWAADPTFRALSSLAMPCDVSSAGDVAKAADVAFASGPVSQVIHCAGILRTGLAWEMPLAEWRKVVDINLFGSLHVMQAFVPRMVAGGEGRLIHIASMAAVTAGAGVAAYSVAKHGVLALCESTMRELAQIGSPVTVHVVCPGAVKTGITRDLGGATSTPIRQLDEALGSLIGEGSSPRRSGRCDSRRRRYRHLLHLSA